MNACDEFFQWNPQSRRQPDRGVHTWQPISLLQQTDLGPMEGGTGGELFL
jgi:hypothetical protein